MSFVDDVKRGAVSFKTKDVLKLLNTTVGWDLKERGQSCEKFVHESGWWFYTGVNFFSLYNTLWQIDVGAIKRMWFQFTKKEEKFVKAWLKANKEEASE